MSFVISSLVSGITDGFVGRVQKIYGVTLVLVFLTFLFARIVGASGELFFSLCFYLLMLEIFAVPVAFIIVASFILNIVMPYILLPFLEWGVDILLFGLNLITFRLLEDLLTNPFRGLHLYWRDINPEPFVTLLLNAIETLRRGLLQ